MMFYSVGKSYLLRRILGLLNEASAKARKELYEAFVHRHRGHGIIHLSCVHFTEEAIELPDAFTETVQHGGGDVVCRYQRACSYQLRQGQW